ncbi:hypothetical protein [Candidatus Protochlamydia phocaeensis]|uniref:hypothetical protein n=1 Tax=Candidatus Protochlamydia phocaeensis TaxID=1414722 RepID=UPI000838D050|nr:hypothetical protein [Candidatus Protochlamydia phocaeensis]
MAVINCPEWGIPPRWFEEQDKLFSALTILSKLEPHQKIRILNADHYQIEPDERSGFWRYWSGDGWLPTLNLICRIFERSLAHTYQAMQWTQQKVGQKEAATKMNEIIKRFNALFPLSLQKFERLRDLYASPKENDSQASKEFTDKISVYTLALLSVANALKETHLHYSQDLTAEKVAKEGEANDVGMSLSTEDVPPPPSSFLQQLTSIQLRNTRAPLLAETPIAEPEKKNKAPLSLRMPLIGGKTFNISLLQLKSVQLKPGSKPIASFPEKEDELKKKFETAQVHQTVLPSKMDQARYTRPKKATVELPFPGNQEKKDGKDLPSLPSNPIPDSAAILEGMWEQLKTKFPKPEGQTSSLNKTEEDEDKEWEILNKSMTWISEELSIQQAPEQEGADLHAGMPPNKIECDEKDKGAEMENPGPTLSLPDYVRSSEQFAKLVMAHTEQDC